MYMGSSVWVWCGVEWGAFHLKHSQYPLPSSPFSHHLPMHWQLPTQSLYNPVEMYSGLFNSFRMLQPNKKGGGGGGGGGGGRGGGRAANNSAGTKRRPSMPAQHVSRPVACVYVRMYTQTLCVNRTSVCYLVNM